MSGCICLQHVVATENACINFLLCDAEIEACKHQVRQTSVSDYAMSRYFSYEGTALNARKVSVICIIKSLPSGNFCQEYLTYSLAVKWT